jgi:hypothetical protein
MKDSLPRFAWSAVDRLGIWRLVLCFEIALDSLDIRESEECAGHGFFTKPGLAALDLAPQMRPLLDWL